MTKSNVLVLMLLAMMLRVSAQQAIEPRYIEVNGEAEIEVIPDEIFLMASINEDKAEAFEKVEKAFFNLAKKMNIADSDISLADMTGEFASAWFRKDQFTKEKIYQVKLTTAEQVGKFLKLAEEAGLKDVQIARTNISNRTEIERSLRIAAVKDAKVKATYMTEAIDGELGDVLTIREQFMNLYRGNERVNDLSVMSSAHMKQKVESNTIVGFKKIRMDIKVSVRFEIK